jgi:ribosomal protein S20
MSTLSGYDLSSRAMLVSLTLSSWGGSAIDRQETKRVINDNGAERDAAKVTKNLVGKALDPVRRSEREIRDTHRHYTLPWADDSTRLLPTRIWEEYNPAMTTLIERHQNEVIPAFLEAYATDVIPSAQKRLGTLFRAEDFPTNIGAKFGVKLRFLPVPDVNDVRVNLSQDEVAALREEVATATREAYEAANREIVERATKPLARLAEALREYGPGKRLQSALLDNLLEIAEVMPGLDLTSSPEIERLAAEIADLASGTTAATLSASPGSRKRVAAEAERLVNKLSSIF